MTILYYVYNVDFSKALCDISGHTIEEVIVFIQYQLFSENIAICSKYKLSHCILMAWSDRQFKRG